VMAQALHPTADSTKLRELCFLPPFGVRKKHVHDRATKRRRT
jgi:hypothetical protein